MTQPAARPLGRLERFLFAPESPAPMVLVRVGWGASVALWGLSLLPDVDPFLTTGALRYERPMADGHWNPLDWVSWSGAPLAACLLLVVAGVATAVGYRTRASALVAVLCLLALQRTNTTIFNSGDLTLRLIGWSVVLAPCGLLWSVDAARRRRRGEGPPPDRAPWALRLLQLNLAVGYFLSGLAKLRGNTWHDGTAVERALRIEDLQRFVVPGWLLDQSILLNLLTWGTLALELGFVLLVWNRRLRPWVIGAGVLFHLGIDLTLDIGWFSLVMWLGYLAFVPPEVAARIVARVDPWARAGGSGAADGEGALVPGPVEPAQ